MRLLIVLATGLQLLSTPFWGQQRDRKPVLIRPDTVEETSEDVPFVPNAEEAKEHLEIGEFYLQKRNYRAAEKRFREAVRNDPRWPKAYENLIRSLEKQGEYSEAARVCDEFVLANQSSPETSRFQTWSEKLRKKEPGG